MRDAEMNAAPRPFDDIRGLLKAMPGPDAAAIALSRRATLS